jgi:SAM-dependent methyltransferase
MSDSNESTITTDGRLAAFQEVWVREAHRADDTGGQFGEAMLDAAQLRAGDRVLDVGCGQGTDTLKAAQQVAPKGSVVGVDITAPLLDRARRRVAETAIDNVEFVQGDAQVHPFEEAAFDVVISRFGSMFFADPTAAFANLNRAIRPGGRMAIVCWQGLLQSEWAAVAVGAVVPHVGMPDITDLGPPGAPGPFAFADGDRLKEIVEAAGLSDVTLEAITRPMRIGEDIEDAVAYITALPPPNPLVGKPADKVAAAVDALREALAPYSTPEGVMMNGTAWLLTARR